MKTADVVKFIAGTARGARVKAAEALGITRGALNNWGEIVPQSSLWRVDRATRGALRPDLELYRKIADKQARNRSKAAKARHSKSKKSG